VKILIISSQYRTGTTMLQSLLCNQHSVTNWGESISVNDEISYNTSVDKLANSDDWCCKLFFIEGMDDWYVPEENVYTLNPTMLINCYREDTLDQFLSLQVSIHNDKWNGTEKLEYKKFTMTNVENDIRSFKSNLSIYNETLTRLVKDYDIKYVSYEELITKTHKTALVKQNTKEEKMKLINNIDEVIEYWNK
jgi:hypothetical protein